MLCKAIINTNFSNNILACIFTKSCLFMKTNTKPEISTVLRIKLKIQYNEIKQYRLKCGQKFITKHYFNNLKNINGIGELY